MSEDRHEKVHQAQAWAPELTIDFVEDAELLRCMPGRPAEGGRGGVAPLPAGDFFAPLEPQLLPFSHSSSVWQNPAHHQVCYLNEGHG